ncbi:acyl-coenzyme A thioesterase 13 isoform 1-T1 [Syngnathus typhle]
MASTSLKTIKQIMRVMKDKPGFDRVLNKVEVVSASPGKVVCEMQVAEEHTNGFGTLHGGLTATLVDVISTMAIMYSDRGAPGVSVDMNITILIFPCIIVEVHERSQAGRGRAYHGSGAEGGTNVGVFYRGLDQQGHRKVDRAGTAHQTPWQQLNTCLHGR